MMRPLYLTGVAALLASVTVPTAVVAATCTSNLPSGGFWSVGSLRYQATAVADQVIRIRIGGNNALPENASWAVLPAARTPVVCGALTASARTLKTPLMTMTTNAAFNVLTVTDNAGVVLWRDNTPTFNANGSFAYSGQIPANSNIFGFGDKPDSIDKIGKSYVNYNIDTYRYTSTTHQMYRTLPFYIRKTGSTYSGYFLDNTWRSTFNFGQATAGQLSMNYDGGGIDHYIIQGASPKEIVETYARLTGTTPLFPRWSYGWQQSKYSYYNPTEVNGVIDGYRNRNIPLDAIWLDIGALNKNTPLTIGTVFEPFTTFVQNTLNRNVRTVLLVNTHPAKITDGSYPAYTEGVANGYLVRNAAGAVYEARVWPWQDGFQVLSVFPDYIKKTARDWWGTLHRERYVTNNVAGIWNDMNEPTTLNGGDLQVPGDVKQTLQEPGFATREVNHREVRNIYGMQNSRGTYEGLLALKPNQRPFVMTRASYTGGQRYAVSWTGDNQSTWDHLRISTNQIAGLGLAGFLSSSDIGGYANNFDPSASLLTRWIQLSAFFPITRTHAERDKIPQEPYANGNQTNIDIRTKYIRERYALMPYIYTLAEEASRTGVPMLRRMFLEFPQATAPGNATPIDVAAETQFMFGPKILVAPSPIEQGFKPAAPITGNQTQETANTLAPYDVLLPPGRWYNYWTGAVLAPPAGVTTSWTYRVTAPSINDVPVFVRDGSIIPRLPASAFPALRSTNDVATIANLQLNVYPGANCSGTVYADDGNTFAFRTGASYRRDFTCSVSGNQVTVNFGAVQGSFTPSWTNVTVTIPGTSANVVVPEARTARTVTLTTG